MKRLIIAAILCGVLGGVHAQQMRSDTTKTATDTIQHKKRHVRIKLGMGEDSTNVININGETTDNTSKNTAIMLLTRASLLA